MTAIGYKRSHILVRQESEKLKRLSFWFGTAKESLKQRLAGEVFNVHVRAFLKRRCNT